VCGIVVGMSSDPHHIVDRLVAELDAGHIHSVAFVVPLDDVSSTLPLYEAAIATARRGWQHGVTTANYWIVTPEPEPLASHARLEPEGITFIGSTYPEVRDGVVLLDPQSERIEADRIVSLDGLGELATA
jgi:hypothetical protein